MTHSAPINLVAGRLAPPTRRPPVDYRQPNPAITRLFSDWSQDPDGGIEAGYTYLGQFLAHELVSGRDPSGAMIERSSLLNLESVYGNGGTAWPQTPTTEDGKFSPGFTLDHSGRQPLRQCDLPRHAKLALIPEPRNDENLVIAQLHCLILRFHNRIVDRLRAQTGFSTLPGPTLFNLARLYVTHALHCIIINDFLHKLADPTVFNLIFVAKRHYISIRPDEAMPPEFTHAAFRFGHSMIAPRYKLNFTQSLHGRFQEATLEQLFRLTGRRGLQVETAPDISYTSIPDNFVIDWRFFFKQRLTPPGIDPYELTGKSMPEPERTPPVNAARHIDPRIIEPMRHMSGEPGDNNDIVLINLARGEELRLLSGQELADNLLARLGMPAAANELGINPRQLLRDGPDKLRRQELLAAAGFLDNTPLWVYILTEAGEQGHGVRLGPLASLIVCESLRNAIANQIALLTGSEQRQLESLRCTLPFFSRMQELVYFVQGDSHE